MGLDQLVAISFPGKIYSAMDSGRTNLRMIARQLSEYVSRLDSSIQGLYEGLPDIGICEDAEIIRTDTLMQGYRNKIFEAYEYLEAIKSNASDKKAVKQQIKDYMQSAARLESCILDIALHNIPDKGYISRIAEFFSIDSDSICSYVDRFRHRKEACRQEVL
jgi:hypothetical protein